MLRPERMSKLSVTGSKRVMGSVVEAVHGLNLLHVSEYDGSWEGFQQGNPEADAEWASEKLVTVRSVESMLGLEAEDAEGRRVVTDDAIEEQLPEIRDEVNALDDRRDELRDELRTVDERIDAIEPFVALGLDLDLLSGYDSLEVAVGEGDEAEIERALLDDDGVSQYDIESGDGVFAVFVYPSEHADDDVLEDALVGTGFNGYEVPEADSAPESYLRELESERQRIESEIAEVEEELDRLRRQHAEFLLAAEEKLTIDVQKAEAPLSFATTENAFIAEGWIPTDEFAAFKAELTDEFGDSVDVEEVERASFKADGDTHHEAVADGGRTSPTTAATDGGIATMGDDEPPVLQDNNALVQPFEVLVEAIGRPNYKEFDPTALLLLTFPAFFGFMIGDLGYGIIYTAIGGYLYTQFDSDAISSMGGVTIAAGLFTMLFGVLYGELFGLHVLGDWVFGSAGPPLRKGLQPVYGHWATTWILVSALAALVHLNIGYVLGFLEELQFHGLKEAIYEKGSWILGMNGLWLMIFSRLGADTKPDFIFTAFDSGPEAAFQLGFAGFSVAAGYLGVGLFLVGLVLLVLGAPAEAIEIFDTLVNVLSYARLSAVLLAKAGMAFTVNLIFFGVWVDGKGGWHYATGSMPDPGTTYHGYEVAEVMFGGLVHGGIASLAVGLLVLVFGHLLVLTLGVTSAGLQSVRLEYYEFFSKFFDGGGRPYEPFGYERRYSNND